jgi:hypothetical protein
VSAQSEVVVLFDVDNTLLDNDGLQVDLDAEIVARFGEEGRRRYRELYEELRGEVGYADYLGALQRFRLEHLGDPGVGALSTWLLQYPFHQRLFEGALDSIDHMGRVATTAILSDGDGVYQPHKIERSGLAAQVGGRVMVYVHKEGEIGPIEARYPATRYVLVDDKPRILAAMKATWGDRVTTVFVRQGHYATDAKMLAELPPADITLEAIGELADLDLAALT